MMRITKFFQTVLLCFIGLLFLGPVNAQTKKKKRIIHHGTGGPVVAAPPPPQIFTMVEQMPEFPGGDAGLQKYLKDNIRYPAQARENEITGKVMLSFFVNEDGSVGDIRIEKKLSGGCDKEAVRVVAGMPKWKPYKLNGVRMRMLYELPVEFKLVDNR